MSSRIFRAIGASPGIAVGKMVFLGRTTMIPSEESTEDPNSEWERFNLGISRAELRLCELQQSVPTAFSDTTRELFESFKTILQDPMICQTVRKSIFEKKTNVEWAVYQAFAHAKDVLSKVPHAHIAEKADDLENVKEMLLETLLGRETNPNKELNGSIVVCESLTPREVLALGQAHAAGLICETGTRASHVAIVARNIGLPAVVGVGSFSRAFKAGDVAVVDGSKGIVEVSPTVEHLRVYELQSQVWQSYGREVQERSALPTITRDGTHLAVLANMESIDEMPSLKQANAEGIGLMRLEFFYMMHEEVPTEDEIFLELARITSSLGERDFVVRLLDAGGDKEISALAPVIKPKKTSRKANTAMGLRGVRLLLKYPSLLLPQIRAALRANIDGRLKLLIPFVVSLDEVRTIKALVREAWRELSLVSRIQPPFPEIGIMVEVPAAAMMIDIFAGEVDFISIGSNDLMQHGLAVDRTDGAVGSLYDWFHPAVLRLLRRIVLDAAAHEIPLSLCGEVGSDFMALELLIGMGIRRLSVSIHAVSGVKDILRALDVNEAEKLVEEVFEMRTTMEIRNRLQDRFIEKFGMDLFALLMGGTQAE